MIVCIELRTLVDQFEVRLPPSTRIVAIQLLYLNSNSCFSSFRPLCNFSLFKYNTFDSSSHNQTEWTSWRMDTSIFRLIKRGHSSKITSKVLWKIVIGYQMRKVQITAAGRAYGSKNRNVTVKIVTNPFRENSKVYWIKHYRITHLNSGYGFLHILRSFT